MAGLIHTADKSSLNVASHFAVCSLKIVAITDLVTVQQHMNDSERNKLRFKNIPTHSNQQLATPLKRFCAKLLSDCKEFDPETSLALLHSVY